MDEARIEQLAAKAQRLAHLTENDSWATFKEIASEREQRDNKRNQAPTPNVDLRGFDYMRGFHAGMNYLIAAAENAEETYQKALRDAEQMEGKVA